MNYYTTEQAVAVIKRHLDSGKVKMIVEGDQVTVELTDALNTLFFPSELDNINARPTCFHDLPAGVCDICWPTERD